MKAESRGLGQISAGWAATHHNWTQNRKEKLKFEPQCLPFLAFLAVGKCDLLVACVARRAPRLHFA